MAEIMKNISKAEVFTLKDQISYQDGQVVSKTLARRFSPWRSMRKSAHRRCPAGKGSKCRRPSYSKKQLQKNGFAALSGIKSVFL